MTSPEIRELNRNLKEAIALLKGSELPISEDEACALLGISKKTIQNYVCDGRMAGTYVINVIGNRMYYKSKLVGL